MGPGTLMPQGSLSVDGVDQCLAEEHGVHIAGGGEAVDPTGSSWRPLAFCPFILPLAPGAGGAC